MKYRHLSQRERVLAYLVSGKTLSRLNAWEELGILECPSRISELRAEGHEIKTERREITNRYGEKVKIAFWTME